MKVVINPKYEHLSGFIHSIPGETYDCEVIRDNRNVIKKTIVDGVQLVIKRYKRPTLANCFIYTFFRKNKAQRSYEYGFTLDEMGVETAESVAYIEISKNGFFHTGYYVSKCLPYPLLAEVENYDAKLRSEILYNFAGFTAFQHNVGIMDGDYNPTNIFFHSDGDSWKFAIIDTNRIKFRRKVHRDQIVEQMQTMSFPIITTTEIVDYYATHRGWNSEILCAQVLLRRGLGLTGRVKRALKALLAKVKP